MFHWNYAKIYIEKLDSEFMLKSCAIWFLDNISIMEVMLKELLKNIFWKFDWKKLCIKIMYHESCVEKIFPEKLFGESYMQNLYA